MVDRYERRDKIGLDKRWRRDKTYNKNVFTAR